MEKLFTSSFIFFPLTLKSIFNKVRILKLNDIPYIFSSKIDMIKVFMWSDLFLIIS